MNRRRTFKDAAVSTLLPFSRFVSHMPRHAVAGPLLASEGEVYVVHSKLHLAQRESSPHFSEGAGCYYLLATCLLSSSRPSPSGVDATMATAVSQGLTGSAEAIPCCAVSDVPAQADTSCNKQEIIVPVSSSCTTLSFHALQQLFSIASSGVQQDYVVLAIVDQDAHVAFNRMYSTIQAPAERARFSANQSFGAIV